MNNECNYGSPYELGHFLKNGSLRENNSRVHWKTFFPPEEIGDTSLEVSCFEVQTLRSSEVFDIADNPNKPILMNNKPPVGYCVVTEEDFITTSLLLDFNDIPPRHVNIKGWEQFPNKEDRIMKATQLAECASQKIFLR
ncbi:MAG: hypothetical protein ACOVSW_12775 [Candidatus Kapaibacteriota bacterium]